MFTGLIEQVGSLQEVRDVPGGRLFAVDTAFSDVHLGESIAVNGVCLTATGVTGGTVTMDLGPETLRVSTLGLARPGDRVNLERAMRGDGRFGGHFVQGHVDGVGTVERVWAEGEAHWVSIAFPDAAAPYLIPKGAIAVDGVSLTVATLQPGHFDVMIVPFTWAHTTLSARQPGDQVNLEYDMVGKYVVRAVQLEGRTVER